jgi:hypothetical protein
MKQTQQQSREEAWPQSDEEKLALKLLLGRLDDRRGSKEEREARVALAQLLRRDNPPNLILLFIADLFDPEGVNPRQITFAHREGGPPRATAKHWQIGLQMLRMWSEGKTVSEAKEAIQEQYGLQPRQIANIWSRFAKYTRKPKS